MIATAKKFKFQGHSDLVARIPTLPALRKAKLEKWESDMKVSPQAARCVFYGNLGEARELCIVSQLKELAGKYLTSTKGFDNRHLLSRGR